MAGKAEKGSLFSRLTKLFRSGPVVRRRVRDFRQQGSSTALEVFRKAHSDVYNSTLSAYGAFDRMSRYGDFSEMDATPEIASGLDIYAEESCSSDDKGQVLHVYSENSKIKEILDELFYDVLNVDFNLVMWIRNLCKYGDFFLFLDISPEYGILNVYPIPISEIEREEGFDANDPAAVRFRWITHGNQTLENWQIAHFRLLGNDAFLPYGSSVLESARRIWRQLIMMEDAMLVYRVIRAPERRVFYIDVGATQPEDVPNYIEQAMTQLKRNQVVDKTTGRVDMRYNPLSVDEDYILPVRGGETGTKIETLAGGQNTAAIEDVQYIQKKLFAALKIPKAYLGYDEDTGAKATLAAEDIRFSRSIGHIQKTIIAELNKLAQIHLYCHGFEADDLKDFTITLTNPSSVAQQQKLQLIKTKFDIAGSAPEKTVDRRWIRKNVLGLTNAEIEEIQAGLIADKEEDARIEAGGAPAGDGESPPEDAGGGAASDLFAGDVKKGQLLTALPGSGATEDDLLDDDDLSIDDEDAPLKAQQKMMNAFGSPIKASRTVSTGPGSTHMPDFAKMTSVGDHGRKQDTFNFPFGENDAMPRFDESFSRQTSVERPRLTKDREKMLASLGDVILSKRKSLLSEDLNIEIEEGPNE